MIIGLIGVGVVGGTLKQWFKLNTTHELRCYDPNKGLNDSLDKCDAIFISVPVPPGPGGQDQSILKQAVDLAKKHSNFVFIRSTVLPGTNDSLGTISNPEFLTERTAFDDMEKSPVLIGECDQNLIQKIFPNKKIVMVSNKEAELAKYTHNCFGAMKVTYFNLIYNIAENIGADFEKVKIAAGLTGFIETTHTQVPGPDGKFGYGGKCFPENMSSLAESMLPQDWGSHFLRVIMIMNSYFRNKDLR